MTRQIVLVGLGLTAAVVAAAGCGLHYWSRLGATLDDFNGDSAACAQAASPAYGILIEDNYRASLRGKGWVRAQRQAPVPPGWYRGIE